MPGCSASCVPLLVEHYRSASWLFSPFSFHHTQHHPPVLPLAYLIQPSSVGFRLGSISRLSLSFSLPARAILVVLNVSLHSTSSLFAQVDTIQSRSATSSTIDTTSCANWDGAISPPSGSAGIWCQLFYPTLLIATRTVLIAPFPFLLVGRSDLWPSKWSRARLTIRRRPWTKSSYCAASAKATKRTPNARRLSSSSTTLRSAASTGRTSAWSLRSSATTSLSSSSAASTKAFPCSTSRPSSARLVVPLSYKQTFDG